MSTDETDADQVPDRDPAPETEAGKTGGEGTPAGGSGGGSDRGSDDPASPEAIERDPSTAGGDGDDLPDGVERLRGG
ncbi:hypothetical protein ACVU7I_19355 [Patulibacter sp. S7RM1-6]